MKQRPYILHALSPLHAGVGQGAGLIDLPIARLKGSNIPFVPSSSIKGVLRDAAMTAGVNHVEEVFGPDTEAAGKHAGRLICTDARLLALPVRSFRGTFAFVTSPLLLVLAARDLDAPPGIPEIAVEQCMAGPDLQYEGKIYLEELDLAAAEPDGHFTAWRDRIAVVFGATQDEQAMFRRRFAVVDDEVMTFLLETATQLDQRVRIDPTTRTVATGALWLEESLPPESLLIGQVLAEPGRGAAGAALTEDAVMDVVLESERVLQLGGKSTVGRGRCRMVPLP